jgi:hypothetical protein
LTGLKDMDFSIQDKASGKWRSVVSSSFILLSRGMLGLDLFTRGGNFGSLMKLKLWKPCYFYILQSLRHGEEASGDDKERNMLLLVVLWYETSLYASFTCFDLRLRKSIALL